MRIISIVVAILLVILAMSLYCCIYDEDSDKKENVNAESVTEYDEKDEAYRPIFHPRRWFPRLFPRRKLFD